MNFKSFLSEKNKKDYASLLEGTMSDIHQLANDSKDIESFTKDFFKQFGAKIKKTTDSVEWVESLYDEMANESAVTEKTYNKKSLMKAMKADDGMIQLGNGEEYVIYAYGNGNDDNDDMWKDKTIFALDQDGEEHEIEYSDIVSYNESAVTEAYTEDDINIRFGFYGRIKHLFDEKTAKKWYDQGVKDLQKKYKLDEKEALLILNFKMGRKAADQMEHGVAESAVEGLEQYYGKRLKSLIKKEIKYVFDESIDYKYNEASVVTEAKPAGLSKKETLKVAQKFADALTKVDGMKYTVSSDYEEDSFDLDIEDQDDVDPRITGEYAGGSYNINADGSVVNMAVWNKKNASPVYGNMDDDIKTIIKTIKNIKESAVTESKITLKRRYTENHPALTVGKRASVRNKMLEAIGDGKITQEEFNDILKELSTNGKRWAKSNSRYFNVSEEGISLSKFGNRALASITINEEEPAKTTNTKPLEMKVNEETIDNPKIWVPGGFDKAISKLPNSQITREVVLKVAKKFKINPDEAISYVEYGWSLDLNENKNTNMKTQFIYESFGDFINSLSESELVINEAFKSSKLRNLLTMSDSMGWGKNDVQLPKAFYQLTKMKLDQIGDEDLIDMTPKEAYKAFANNKDMVVFYVVDSNKENPFGQGTLKPGLLALTRAKDFLGVQYERSGRRDRSKKTLKGGDNRMTVGGNKAYKGYDATGVSSIKRAADLADRAIAFSLTNPMKSSADDVSNRIDQKSGATAFKSDADFKKANKARYQEILATKASKLPLDKMVNDAIDALSSQIKDGLARNEKGRYGDIIIGINSKGREAKMRDASNHMSNILDDYSRYVDYVKQAEAEKESGYSSKYYQKESQNYAKEIKDKVSKIKKFDYAW